MKLTALKAKKRAWTAFSKYIRLRDALKTTKTREWVICVTCRKRFPAFGPGCAQAGHFIPGRHNAVLFNEKMVNAQCRGCNVWGGGKLPEYEAYMQKTYGPKVVAELWKLSRENIQYKVHDYLEIEEKYKNKFKKLCKMT